MSIKPSRTYLISAGEFSGDLLASELVHALREVLPDHVPFGIVGPTMQLANVQGLASISELSVMGIVDVARRINDIRMLETRILAWVDRHHPQFAVLVDFPGFHFRLAEQLRMRDVIVYQYVAPKVWAWGKDRVEKLRENFDAVYGVLPFEEEFFLQNDVPYTYVGSPHYDRVSKINLKAADLGLPSDRPIVAFLPGSRLSELERILPVMQDIRRELVKLSPDTVCVIPLASGLNWNDVTDILGPGTIKQQSGHVWEFAGFHWLQGSSIELMKISRSAVVASGTATLECAIAGTPMIVVYAMSDLNYMLAKRAVKLRWISLVNLLMNEAIVSEYIQTFSVRKIAEELLELMSDSLSRRRMIANFDVLVSRLQPGAAHNTAELIVQDLKSKGL